MAHEIVEQLKREIAGFRDEPEFERIGTVTETGDGIAKISGLGEAVSQELLAIETASGEVTALAANLEEAFIGAIILGNADAVRVGDRVKKTGAVLSIPVGRELIGRVVDPLGEPLDGKGVIFKDAANAQRNRLEKNAPSVVARESVNVPLHTGIKSIDAMIPIGRGQRELIIGDRQTGKTAIALDTILNQRQDPGRRQVICIYVAIGQKNSKVAKIVKLLEEQGALAYTIVVSAPASAPAALQYLAPFAGAAIGEYFMESGQDALVVYDDLSKHADAYRQLSLLLRRPPGREAYPGDIFYLHSRLLERAAKLSEEHGGGSLTALPIIETKLGDVAAYIPTNVISITDGQIFLQSELFFAGIRPAVNVGISVSRVGSTAQTKAMKKVAGRLRLELAQFRELAAFVQFASDLDEATKAKIRRGELLTEILKQSDIEPVPFERQVVVLYAALNGYLDDIAIADVKAFEAKLLDYLDKRYRDTILAPIAKSGALDDAAEAALTAAIEEAKRM
ncbi:F0F1 ATP synthase subunit alpha [Candidatus Parcubacteria bacterium]|nr:MAG: F0F1 ATP synthase subunit alpha [Candidatus Parcubacteria bacterium]